MPITDNISQSGSSDYSDEPVKYEDIMDCTHDQVQLFIESLLEYGTKHGNSALVSIAESDDFQSELTGRCEDAVAFMLKKCVESDDNAVGPEEFRTRMTMACGKALANSYVTYCKNDGNDTAAEEASILAARLSSDDTYACAELKRHIDSTYGRVKVEFVNDDYGHEQGE